MLRVADFEISKATPGKEMVNPEKEKQKATPRKRNGENQQAFNTIALGYEERLLPKTDPKPFSL